MSLVVGCACTCTRHWSLKYLKTYPEYQTLVSHQLWMQVQHKTLNSLLLCVSYKPPDCDISCFEDFRERYTQALAYGLPILVVGDLNCDLIVSSSKSKTLYNLCTSLNMKQLITQPTRLTETSKTLIDVSSVAVTWNWDWQSILRLITIILSKEMVSKLAQLFHH